jgi:hypothetical protein
MKSVAHYDYDKQVWIMDGLYVRCGHPESMPCTCYGRKHAGESAVLTQADVSAELDGLR